jgi:hypothetical protein
MFKLLNQNITIPNLKNLDNDILALLNNYRDNVVIFKDGKHQLDVKQVYYMFVRHFPSIDKVMAYIDMKFINSVFKSKLNLTFNLDLERIQHDYEDFLKSKMEAPASISFSEGRIIFRQNSILKIILNRFAYLYAYNHNLFRFNSDLIEEFLLIVHLFLLDHELAHLFFSPNREELEQVKKQFIQSNPSYKDVSDKVLHRISNYIEDMYIEDKYKALIYPNDPSIHLVYDIGRFLLGR